MALSVVPCIKSSPQSCPQRPLPLPTRLQKTEAGSADCGGADRSGWLVGFAGQRLYLVLVRCGLTKLVGGGVRSGTASHVSRSSLESGPEDSKLSKRL